MNNNNVRQGGGEEYSRRTPAIKRILREAFEMKDATYEYYAQPLEENLFEWHFTVRGAEGTEFEEGYYHGRIILPNDYPMKPPSIILLTPNGRFEVNKKICLSISGHHPETWQPCWSIRTVLLAISAFMPTQQPEISYGALDYPPTERRKLARQSTRWRCPTCGPIVELLKNEKDIKPKPACAVMDQANGEDKMKTITNNSATTTESTTAEEEMFKDFMAKVSFTGEKSVSTLTANITTSTATTNIGTSDHSLSSSVTTHQQINIDTAAGGGSMGGAGSVAHYHDHNRKRANSITSTTSSSTDSTLSSLTGFDISSGSNGSAAGGNGTDEESNSSSTSTTSSSATDSTTTTNNNTATSPVNDNQLASVIDEAASATTTTTTTTATQSSSRIASRSILQGPMGTCLTLAIIVLLFAILARRIYPYVVS